jgi:hypothetical protein
VTGQGCGWVLVDVTSYVPRPWGLAWLYCFPVRVDYGLVVALDPQSSHRYIVPSTYLLMGAERLVALLSWVPALSGPTVTGGF